VGPADGKESRILVKLAGRVVPHALSGGLSRAKPVSKPEVEASRDISRPEVRKEEKI
jgi:hypothetical protein